MALTGGPGDKLYLQLRQKAEEGMMLNVGRARNRQAAIDAMLEQQRREGADRPRRPNRAKKKRKKP